MKPDELMGAWSLIITDVFGRNACFVERPITCAEWVVLDQRWTAMKGMNYMQQMRREEEQHGNRRNHQTT